MSKQTYKARIVFTSKAIQTHQAFEHLLKPYSRNTYLDSISVSFGPPDTTKIEVSLVIYSKNCEKANTTLNLICEDIKYYSGFNCGIWDKQLTREFQYHFWMDPFTGERQMYVKR
jgi:hypothetical protein